MCSIMSFYGNLPMRPNQRLNIVPIEKSSDKIVIFNDFENMGVEFTNMNNHFCREMVHSGLSSLCVCSYEWKNWLSVNDVYMHLSKQSFELVKLHEANSRPNFHFYYVAKLGESQPLQNTAMMRLRASNYFDSGEATLHFLNHQIPDNMKEWFSTNAYRMKPTFYDFRAGIALEPCCNESRFCNYWQ